MTGNARAAVIAKMTGRDKPAGSIKPAGRKQHFNPGNPHEKDVIRMNATLLHTLSGTRRNARPAFMYGFRKRHGERRFK